MALGMRAHAQSQARTASSTTPSSLGVPQESPNPRGSKLTTLAQKGAAASRRTLATASGSARVSSMPWQYKTRVSGDDEEGLHCGSGNVSHKPRRGEPGWPPSIQCAVVFGSPKCKEKIRETAGDIPKLKGWSGAAKFAGGQPGARKVSCRWIHRELGVARMNVNSANKVVIGTQ